MIETTKGLKLPESSEFVKVKENISDNFQKTETFIINNDGAEVGYNGITHIQDDGEKVAGKLYYDKLQPGLFYCKVSTVINYNSAEYFDDYSNYANGNKLQNLINSDGDIQNKIVFKQYSWNSSAGITQQIVIPIGINFKKVLSYSLSALNGKFPLQNHISGTNIILGHDTGPDGYWINPQNSGGGVVYLVLLV